MQYVLLGVNIDHVATLRQVRKTSYPEPLHAALLAEQAGADSITVHLREDRRHIQERDVTLLKEVVGIPLNLEMAVTNAMLAFAEHLKPRYCCLVPEKREELTTEGGLDVRGRQAQVAHACQSLKSAGILVSLFVDPDVEQIAASRDAGASAVEIHTGRYADADDDERGIEFEKIIQAVRLAHDAGLRVNAGHGLNYRNVQTIAGIPELYELNIGHAIVARAVLCGMMQAVAEMKLLMNQARM
ncbi:MAG TPA: pyridoxine 5'-phosphate synthase [Gammaproteobacteria bacterium]|nr:pyridoxine 5'-phosphate synthase [Gammaproteobacteria bacterium]